MAVKIGIGRTLLAYEVTSQCIYTKAGDMTVAAHLFNTRHAVEVRTSTRLKTATARPACTGYCMDSVPAKNASSRARCTSLLKQLGILKGPGHYASGLGCSQTFCGPGCEPLHSRHQRGCITHTRYSKPNLLFLATPTKHTFKSTHLPYWAALFRCTTTATKLVQRHSAITIHRRKRQVVACSCTGCPPH